MQFFHDNNGKMGSKIKSPWSWVPSLYYAQGIPFVTVMAVSVIMYKRLGISNAEIALYTSWLYLPWVIKPIWSPVVDALKTKRWWIVAMQLMVGASLAGVALTIPAPDFFRYTLAFFWLLAFSSATHDIAADGFYMMGLNQKQQAFFVGIRSTFYRLAMISGQGVLVIIAGTIETRTGLEPLQINVFPSPATEAPALFSDTGKTAQYGELQFLIAHEISHQLPADWKRQLVIDSLKSDAKKKNITNGFTIYEPVAIAGVKNWFTLNVSEPLTTKLKSLARNSADTIVTSYQQPGSIHLKGITLSGPPEHDQLLTLNTGFDSGNRGFRIIEGERLTFTPENWNSTAWIVIEGEPGSPEAYNATFRGSSGNSTMAWSIAIGGLSILIFILMLYHRHAMPRPKEDVSTAVGNGINLAREYAETFKAFFRKDGIGLAITFLLVYRLGEAQLVKLAAPFLLDGQEAGGLGLSTVNVGVVFGTIGIIALVLGGITGGIATSKQGLKFWILPMALAMNLPNIIYVVLAYTTPDNLLLISIAVAIEQFGYGFGFTGYIMYMISFSDGKHKTAHYAICTGFMALGMMIPGMISGWIQEIIGYQYFFIWVVLCTIPGILLIRKLDIDPGFGVKKNDENV